jgi:hypothetical protein
MSAASMIDRELRVPARRAASPGLSPPSVGRSGGPGGGGLLGSILGGAVAGVSAKHPPAQPDHAQKGDQERKAHPEPGWDPFTGEEEHAAIIADAEPQESRRR